ncbi:hypothetical protein DCAR_0521895 [Daucus carota subsp. sativus]|uniref:Uncharacterized protein n=1 Tax=Daucus carota subsp. sativus TaxID=79200 RepID=A0A162A402_DAUCS|nr:hypothetical protein DCAR_0521895 [Daucus carota subsp. sativus]
MEQKKSSACLMHQDSLSDEEGETLSLRDLPIYGESDYAEDEHGSSSDEHFLDHFEFFSEEWSSPVSFPADNIVFCGKLIPNKDYKERRGGKHAVRLGSKTSRSCDQKGECGNANKGSGLGYAQNFNSVAASNCMNKLGKCEDKNDVLAYKITIIKSPTRSRWFLFFFGSGKGPRDMEIKDMRRRQIKKSLSQQSLGGGSAKISSRKSRGMGWWKFIRALGCDSQHHADSVIKASYNCAPLIRE